MTMVKYFSDNCAGQFKISDFFFVVGVGSIDEPVTKRGSDRQAFPLAVMKWYFWAACHGKNVSDSEGSTLMSRPSVKRAEYGDTPSLGTFLASASTLSCGMS